MKKKRHDAQLKKTTESKKKEDENLVKSAGGQTNTVPDANLVNTTPSNTSSQARREKYTRSVTMDASMINRGNGVVQKSYSGMQSANPPTTPGGSFGQPTFASNQFTSSRASSTERKTNGNANFVIGSQRSSPVENNNNKLSNNAMNSQVLKKAHSVTASSSSSTTTTSSSINKFQQSSSQQISTSTSSSTTSTSNSSKLARNKSMPASSLSKKEQFLAKLEQNADPNRGSMGGNSFKNARSTFNSSSSGSSSVKRGSSFVVPNATGVKQLLLRWCQQRTNGYDVSTKKN